MMKAGILTQIMVTPISDSITQEKARSIAITFGFRMYSFHGRVYSVKSDDELFILKDLVDYNYNP